MEISKYKPLHISLRSLFSGLQPDGELTCINDYPTFDIYEVDKRIHELVGNYEEEGKSMADIIEECMKPEDRIKARKHLGL